MNILFIIPARGGSKGIPRKNLRPLAHKPLISYSIQNALQSRYDGDVYVSSEDEEILHTALKFGAKIHRRRNDLAGDAITLDPVIYHAYRSISQQEGKQYQLIVTLQPTSPLLQTESIDEALRTMIDQPEIDTIISATDDTHLTWGKNEQGYFPQYKARLNRQYLPPNFKETGGFLITRDRIIEENNRIGPKVSLQILARNEAIDIDNFEDWNLCEYYIKKKKVVCAVIGYPQIGMGHIYNSLIIANEILNHQLSFLVDKKSDLGKAKLLESNYEVHQQQSEKLVDDLLAMEPDIVINDLLDTSADYVQALKASGIKVINFEDLGPGAAHADLVFNAIYPEKEQLHNHYFGPSYFCAREEFILTSPKALAPEIKNILLTFGGVDPNNLTIKVLELIYEHCVEQGITLNIVAGLGYQQYDSLRAFDQAHIHQNISNISDFMRAADLAFTSAGRTTYELALMGVPTIVMAQNEREQSHFFAYPTYGFINLGLGTEVTAEQLLLNFNHLINNFDARRAMRDKMFAHDLRNGKRRVIKLINDLIAAE
ncbi:MAG: acylneuraminate cytidylyltransferase [Bacteroidota bacterium]